MNLPQKTRKQKGKNRKLIDDFIMAKKKKKQKKETKEDKEQVIEEDEAYSTRELEEDF